MYKFIVVSVFVISLCACSPKEHSFLDYGSKSEQLISCYKISDSLVEQMTAKNNAPTSILRNPFVNANAPEAISTLGQSFSDAVASRLAQRGLNVISPVDEIQRTTKAASADEAKYNHNTSTHIDHYKAEAVLVGHFKKSQSNKSTTLFVKILNARTNAIIASEEYELED